MKIWRLCFTVLAALVVLFAWRAEYNHDEIEHLHAAWLLSVGQRPFADFLEQHHPTIWILFSPLAARLHTPQSLMFAARLFDLAVMAALLWTLHRLVRRLVPTAAPWAVLLVAASFTFAHNMLLFRPDPLMNALFYAGLLHWAAFLQEGRLGRALLAGLFFGLAIAVLQKALAVVGLVGLAALILLVLRRRRALLLGGLAALGAALLPLGLLWAWVATHGIWREFWFWNYEFNRFFYTQATLSTQFAITDNLVRSLIEDPVLWIFGAAGVVLWWRRARQLDDVRLTLLVVLSGYMIFLAFNKFPFQQYFIVFLPLWAPFAAEVFARDQWVLPTRLLAAAMVVIALAMFVDLSPNTPHRARQDYVLAHTTVEETIYVSPPNHPLFRLDGSFFWYNGALIGEALAAYDLKYPGLIDRRLIDDEKWTAHTPSLVYIDPRYPGYRPYRWSEHAAAYHPTDIPNLLIR